MQSGAFRIDKILGMCERLMYFLGVNLCFLVSNLPVLLFFLFVGISQVRTCLPLFLLCMVPFGPSLSAVFYCMNRVVDGTETGVLRNFWHGYRTDWFQKIRLCFYQMAALLVLWTNVEFFRFQLPIPVLSVVWTVIFAAVVCLTPLLYLLASRYSMGNRQIIKDAVILLVTRPVLTLGNVAALAIILMCLELSAGTTVLFMGSVYGFLTAYMSRRLLRDLEVPAEISADGESPL